MVLFKGSKRVTGAGVTPPGDRVAASKPAKRTYAKATGGGGKKTNRVPKRKMR
jgi:hypothetical protein